MAENAVINLENGEIESFKFPGTDIFGKCTCSESYFFRKSQVMTLTFLGRLENT